MGLSVVPAGFHILELLIPPHTRTRSREILGFILQDFSVSRWHCDDLGIRKSLIPPYTILHPTVHAIRFEFLFNDREPRIMSHFSESSRSCYLECSSGLNPILPPRAMYELLRISVARMYYLRRYSQTNWRYRRDTNLGSDRRLLQHRESVQDVRNEPGTFLYFQMDCRIAK
jgi:hypothetical protein